jgi:hypothetical protein
MMRTLEGTWFVVATSFPMWLKGDRTKPRFSYSNIRSEGGRTRMDDTVLFERGGKDKTIRGVDTQDTGNPRRWRWRGKGWLLPFTSDWEVVEEAADGAWLVIAFTKSLATPAGVDVIARAPTLSDAQLASILAPLGAAGAAVRKL